MIVVPRAWARGEDPEELIGAAHAGCFSMALAAALGGSGFLPRRIATTADVALEKVGDGFKITNILLRTRAEVPGIDQSKFPKWPRPPRRAVLSPRRSPAPTSGSRRASRRSDGLQPKGIFAPFAVTASTGKPPSRQA